MDENKPVSGVQFVNSGAKKREEKSWGLGESVPFPLPKPPPFVRAFLREVFTN